MSGIVDVWCDGCRFVSKGGGTPTCEYMTMTGRRRGCPAGNGCIKRERPEGWKPQRILYTDEQWFRMQALKKAEEKARKRIFIEPKAKPGAMRKTEQKQKAEEQPRRSPKKRVYTPEQLKEKYRRAKEKSNAEKPVLREKQREIIQAWRRKEGLSQKEAAERMGISTITLNRWECGARKANWQTLADARMEVPETLLYENGV